MPEPDRTNRRTLTERLYNANVLPDGNLNNTDLIDVVSLKIETDATKESKEEEGP